MTREDIGVSDNSIRLIERLAEFLMDSHPTNKWLTNEIIDSPIIGHIYFYEFNPVTKNLLLEWGDNTLSDLPEDIAFYDKEKNPLLYVNGHENYAIIEVSSLKDFLKIALL